MRDKKHDDRDQMKALWRKVLLTTVPDDDTWSRWYRFFQPPVIREAMVRLASRYTNLKGQMSLEQMVQFASTSMVTVAKEQQEALRMLRSKSITSVTVSKPITAEDSDVEMEDVNYNR